MTGAAAAKGPDIDHGSRRGGYQMIFSAFRKATKGTDGMPRMPAAVFTDIFLLVCWFSGDRRGGEVLVIGGLAALEEGVVRQNVELYMKILEVVEPLDGSAYVSVDPDDCPGYSLEQIDAHVEMLIEDGMVDHADTVGPALRGLTTAGRRRLEELRRADAR